MIKYINIAKLIGTIVIVLASSCAIQDHIKETLGFEVEKKLNKNKSASIENTDCHIEALFFSEDSQSLFNQNEPVRERFHFIRFTTEVENAFDHNALENLQLASVPIYITLQRLKIDLI